jgi:hypothetical protein
MNHHDQREDTDPKLRALLRETMPRHDLPARFAEAVWHRIEREESLAQVAPAMPSWLDRFARLVLQPRLALAIVAAVMIAGAVLGFMTAGDAAREAARASYLTAVTPYAKAPQS